MLAWTICFMVSVLTSVSPLEHLRFGLELDQHGSQLDFCTTAVCLADRPVPSPQITQLA